MHRTSRCASINLMPLYVWKKLMLPELIPTHMTLELANRSVAYPAGIVEDVCVQVGKFTFPANFVVVNYDVDPRVPLILERPFLRTARALVDVYGEELILRDDHFQEVLKIKKSNHPLSGSTTTPFDSFPSLEPFEISDSLLEEFVDDIHFDVESNIRELEYLLNLDPSIDSSPKDNIE
ncbi:reverse transcriptase domain-containing protein [Tanacetum coccineum]